MPALSRVGERTRRRTAERTEMSNADLIKRLRGVWAGEPTAVLCHEAADALAAQEWQPMETAPINIEVLGWCAFSHALDPYWTIDRVKSNGRDWWTCLHQPTPVTVKRWMPLPTPPESTK